MISPGTISAALLLRGVSSIMLQTLLARELLAVFYGNELTLGATFGLWLFFGGLGSAGLGPLLNAKAKDPFLPYAIVQILQSIWALFALCLIRGSKTLLGLPAAEVLSLGATLCVMAAGIGVVALADGTLFSLGMRLFLTAPARQDRPLARLYILESLGAAIGAGAFTLLLMASVDPFRIAGSLLLVNGLCAILLARSIKGRGRSLAAALGVAAVTIFFSAPSLRQATLRLQWPHQTVKLERNSLYGHIAVLEQEGQQTIFYDGLPTIAAPHPEAFFTEDFIHLPLLAQPQVRKVLFIGHAAGGPLREIFKYPVQEVVYLEPDPLMFDVLRSLKDPGIDAELNDPRVRREVKDARHFFKTAHEKFDAVFLYTGLPTSLAANRTATVEAFREIARILEPRGFVVCSIPGSLVALTEELKRMNAMALKTCRAALSRCEVIPGDGYNIFIAGEAPSGLDPSAMTRRLKELDLQTHLINPAYLELRLDPSARRWFDEEVGQALGRTTPNQDLRPVGLYEGLSLHYAQFSKNIPGILKMLQTQPPARLIGSLFLAWLFLLFLATRRGRRTAPLSLAVATTGFFGISIQIATLFLFQSLLGLLYFWLAVLTTSFMAGTCAGAVLAGGKKDPGRAWTSIIAAESILTLAPILLLTAAMVFYRQPGYPQAIIKGLFFASSFSAGFLVGVEVPIVFEVLRGACSGGPVATARLAAKLYALDLAGACLGAVITPLILIPACGLPDLLLLLYAVKASSGLNIAFSRPRPA